MFEAGELVVVPFPFTDLSSAKRRPVLALTAPDTQGDFIGCPVTSRNHWAAARPLFAAVMLQGALPRPSWVRTDHVVTLHDSLVVKNFGRVSDAFRRAVIDDLCSFMLGAPVDAGLP